MKWLHIMGDNNVPLYFNPAHIVMISMRDFPHSVIYTSDEGSIQIPADQIEAVKKWITEELLA